MSSIQVERWKIPADLDRVGRLVLEVEEVLESRGVAGRALFRAQLLLEEIASNVVRHGHRGDRTRSVDVEIAIDEGYVSIVVEDDARAFDPLEDAPVPDTEAALRDRSEGGLGVHLVRNMADEVFYEREGRTNRVRMLVAVRS